MPPSIVFKAAKALIALDDIQVIQRVTAFQVVPGPRSVRFKLRLIRPASPVFAVFLRRSSSSKNDFGFPPAAVAWSFLFVDTKFDGRLAGLQPETHFRYRLTIPTETQGTSIVLTGEFFTGRRESSVRVEEIIMFSGGSEDIFSGDPDVTFFTTVYDGETRGKLVDQKIFGEINATNGVFKLPFGTGGSALLNPPDVIIPYIHAYEDDTAIFEFPDARAVSNVLEQLGSFENASGDGVFVGDSTEVFLPDAVGEHSQSFTLNTGPREMHFIASGTIRTTVVPPRAVPELRGVARSRTVTDVAMSLKPKKKKSAVLPKLGLRLAVSDGQLFARPLARPVTADSLPEWRLLGEGVGDALAAVAVDGAACVFVASERGGMRSALIGAAGEEVRWGEHDGPELDAITAVSSGRRVHLLGLDSEGRLHHATASRGGGVPQPGRWSVRGGPFVDLVAAEGRTAPTVFALAPGGQISRATLDATSERTRWSELRGPKVTTLSLHADTEDLTLVGVDVQGRAHARTLGRGGEVAGRGWVDLGPIDLFNPEEPAAAAPRSRKPPSSRR